MLVLLPLLSGLVAAGPLIGGSTYPVEERQLPAGNPCESLVGDVPFYAPHTVLACMQSIAFKPAVRTNVMAVADAIYTQLDVLAANQLGDSEESVNQGVNLQAEFQRINSTDYTSDFDFQYDLSRVMTTLNDGHKAWASCYQSLFTTMQAIPIISLSDSAESTTPSIYIVPDVAQFVNASGFSSVYTKAGINVTELGGNEVLSIEGKPAWNCIQEDKLPVTGRFLDKQQRLNSVFVSYAAEGGVWGRAPGKFTSTRDWTKDNITMSVKTVAGKYEDIVVPWVVKYAGGTWNYTTGESFWNANCGSVGSGTTNSSESQDVGASTGILRPTATDLESLARSAYQGCPATQNTIGITVPPAEDPTRSPSYLGGRDVMFFSLPNKVGVVYLSTFAPTPPSVACVTRFFIDLVYGLRNFTSAGIENVLIDTSNNGGGAIVLSQIAQVLFTGQRPLNEANFETVLRRSPLSEALLQRFIDNSTLVNTTSTYNPNTYRNSTSLYPLPSNNNLFSPGREYKINNQTLRTSNLLRDSVEQIEVLDKLFEIPDTAPFPPKNIVFTGNGLCGSACATFTNFLIEYYNGTGYIQAAQPSKPIEYAGFMAGQALTTDTLYQEAAAIGFNNTSLLPKLNVAGGFGFAARAGISPFVAPGEFLQYRSFPAANRFALTKDHYADQIASWNYVAGKAFPRLGFNATGVTGAVAAGPTGGAGAAVAGIASMGIFVAIVVSMACLYQL